MIIVSAYQRHMSTSLENELSAYVYSILAVAEVENSNLIMPEALAENQFNVSQSGLYAAITLPNIPLSQAVWRSESLLTVRLPSRAFVLEVGEQSFKSLVVNNTPHFLFSYAVSFTDEDSEFPLALHIIKDKSEFLSQLTAFKQQVVVGLLILMIVILLVQLLWLKWTLNPLSTLEQEIRKIEQGVGSSLTEHYPKELSKVTDRLNQLLATEQKQRVRYRNSLSDLAHSLKTPLAVLQAEPNISAQSLEQLQRINNTIEHQLKRAQSAGHNSWLVGVNIKECANKLITSLHKIYRDKQVECHIVIAPEVSFKGDEADLLEILGNLLDNAYKAAKHRVNLTVNQNKEELHITIEDDGSGISEDVKQVIFERGVRADTYQHGHGVGLAIVRDLVESYSGKLTISQSQTLLGAKFVLVFDVLSKNLA